MVQAIEAVIEEVVIQPKKVQPIIVNFQNGELKDEETKKMKCGLYKDEKQDKLVIALSNGSIVYKGFRPDLSKELTYTMLAIHNKKTGKVRLVQAERWNVAPVLDEAIDNENDDEVDRNAELNKTFGSKKAKRRTEQYEKMKVNNVDNIKEQLEKIVSNIEIEKLDLEPVSKDDFVEGLHLPVCNRDANKESDVYNIYDIVPKGVLETLFDKTLEVAESDLDEKPDFFKQTVEHIKDAPDFNHKMALLLYMEAVIHWFDMPIKLAKRSDVNICAHSEEVNKYVIKNFSMLTGHVRTRPNIMKDKGIIHCILLGLELWNYKLDLELFSSMFFKLRIGIKKLFELARWILAVPHKTDKTYVVLKIPLPSAPSNVFLKRKNSRKN